MAKPLKKMEKWLSKHKNVIGLAAILVTLGIVLFPQEASQVAQGAQGEGEDLIAYVTNIFGVPIGDQNSRQREWQVHYNEGQLEDRGEVAIDNASFGQFAVTSTTPAGGNAATFELVCNEGESNESVCGEVKSQFQDPLTFFVVSIPWKPGLDALRVTAGGATLEIDLR